MYQNKSKITTSLIISILQWILTGPLGILCLLVSFDFLGDAQIGTAIFSFVISALLLLVTWSGIRKAIWRNQTARYNGIFEGYATSLLPLKELSKKTGKPEEKVKKEIETLIAKRYLINCSPVFGSEYRILLDGKPAPESLSPEDPISAGTKKRSPKKMRSIQCPHCGGTSRVEEGAELLCEYCGSSLEIGK